MDKKSLEFQGSEIDKLDNTTLQKLLNIEQIKAIKRENKRGWMWHMGPTLGAIAASLVASIIIIFFGSQIVKGVVAYYQSNVGAARDELAQLKNNLVDLKLLKGKMEKEVDSLKEKEKLKLLSIAAINDHSKQLSLNEAIGISVKIQDDQGVYYLSVDTYPKNAKIYAFYEIIDNFVFPGQIPDIEKSKTIFDIFGVGDESAKGKRNDFAFAPCIVGPIQALRDDYFWIMAEYNGKRSFKCVHLAKKD